MAEKEVVLVARISGTRNGEDWPEPGNPITLPEDEANLMIRQGTAVTTASPAGAQALASAAVRAAQLARNAALMVAQHQEAADASAATSEAAQVNLDELRDAADRASKAASKVNAEAAKTANSSGVDLEVIETAMAGTTSTAVAPGTVKDRGTGTAAASK